jgi:hypothetical protein
MELALVENVLAILATQIAIVHCGHALQTALVMACASMAHAVVRQNGQEKIVA